MPIDFSSLLERNSSELHVLLDSSGRKIRILVWRGPLIARLGRRVSRRLVGLFDRTLGRIELFECDAEARDEELVCVLIHELLHAKEVEDEGHVRRTARRLTAALAPEIVARLADVLRAEARDRSVVLPAETVFHDSPLGMGR